MTIFDPEISKGTRILQAIGGFVVLSAFIGVIIFTASGWNNAASDARDAQRDFYSQVTKTEKLQSEYNKLYSEYLGATGKKPDAASPKSIQGETGAEGAKGDRGERGLSGPPGEIGPKGENGQQGPAGQAGINGSNGSNGSKGDVGATGAQGPAGPQGSQGEPGPQGVTGPTGPVGPIGVGVSSINCLGDGTSSTWSITYTDGTTQQVAGPCRLAILP